MGRGRGERGGKGKEQTSAEKSARRGKGREGGREGGGGFKTARFATQIALIALDLRGAFK